MTTLEELLRMMVPIQDSFASFPGQEMSPEFVISVQEVLPYGVRIIVHANGHNSETLDFMVRNNNLEQDDFGPSINVAGGTVTSEVGDPVTNAAEDADENPIISVEGGLKPISASCPYCGVGSGGTHSGWCLFVGKQKGVILGD